MSLVKWDPLREMDHMLHRYDRDLLAQRGMDLDFLARGDWAPRVDIAETDKAFVIKMEIPEVDKKDVKILGRIRSSRGKGGQIGGMSTDSGWMSTALFFDFSPIARGPQKRGLCLYDNINILGLHHRLAFS